MNLLLLAIGIAGLLWVCWAAGVLATRGLGLRGPWWFHLGAGQAALGTLWTWLILAGVFRAPLVAATLLTCGIVGTWITFRSRTRSFPTEDPPDRLPAERRAGVLERAMLFLVFGLLVLVACYPYQGSDFLSYQLPMAQGYAEQGQWVWFDHLRFPTFPPLMNGWFAVALMLGGRWQIPLAQLSALLPLLVLCAALVRLTRDTEPDARPTWALALFLGSPAVAWAGMHAYVDGAMALFMVMATWCVLRFARHAGFDDDLLRDPGSAAPSWRWLVAAGALVGAAMNTKYLGAAFVPLLGAWLLLNWWKTEPAVDRRVSSLLLAGLAFCGSAFVTAAPWYLATWIQTGNPLFPFAQSIFGPNPWGWMMAPLQQVQSRPAELLGSPLTWDGLSPWLFLTTIVAIWSWLRRGLRTTTARGLMLFVGVGYLLLWFLMPDDRRYLLPSLALLSVAGAPVVQSLAHRIPALSRSAFGRAIVTGVLLLLGIAFLGDQVRDHGGPPPGPADLPYAMEHVPGVAALVWTETHLEPKRIYVPTLEGVRSFARTSIVVGDWSGPWSRGRLLADIQSPQDLLQRLEENEIGAILVSRCRRELPRHKLRIDQWVLEGRLPAHLGFGTTAAARPFTEPASAPGATWTPLEPRAVHELFDDALEVAYRDGDICVLKPRSGVGDETSRPTAGNRVHRH